MFVADVKTIDKALAFCHSEIKWLDAKPEPWAARKAAQMRDILELLGVMRRRMQMTTVGGKELSDSASACPYGQKDCESTKGGVCVCAMPETVSEEPK